VKNQLLTEHPMN